jgi:hypothetical protein
VARNRPSWPGKHTLTLSIIFGVALSCGTPGTPSDPETANPSPLDVASAPAPLFRDPILDGAADPSVIWNPSAKEWWIFYTQRRATARAPGVAWCYGSKIGIAASSDQGRHWYYRGTASGLEFEDGESTFWAPHVMVHEGTYHMFVSYIRGIWHDWGGERHILHFVSDNLWDWSHDRVLPLSSDRVIDPVVFGLPDGTWKMWYKDEADRSHTHAALSRDLYEWEVLPDAEIRGPSHEAPNVFRWKGFYWCLSDTGEGLRVHRSEDAESWTEQERVLVTPGKRRDDGWYGQHPDVVQTGDRAFIFYFVHPERTGQESFTFEDYMPIEYKRSSLQIAELGFENGVLYCDRDRYHRED